MDNFTAVPNEWFDHLADGRLTVPMFTIMCLLKRSCTWQTGAWRGTARRMQYLLGGDNNPETSSVRQINRYITRLHQCGYIQRMNTPGRAGDTKSY